MLPDFIRWGICAPATCTSEQVLLHIFPRYMTHVLRIDLLMHPPSSDDAKIFELSHWSQLHLDFVIAGVGSCGTTSLHWNMGRHAEIAFSNWPEEDPFFFMHDGVLPYKEEIEKLNSA